MRMYCTKFCARLSQSLHSKSDATHLIQMCSSDVRSPDRRQRLVVHWLILLQRQKEALIPDEGIVCKSALSVISSLTISIQVTATDPNQKVSVECGKERGAGIHVGQIPPPLRTENDDVLQMPQLRSVRSPRTPHITRVYLKELTSFLR